MVVYALSPDSARIGAGSLLHVQAMKSIGEDLYVNEWTETLQGAWASSLVGYREITQKSPAPVRASAGGNGQEFNEFNKKVKMILHLHRI